MEQVENNLPINASDRFNASAANSSGNTSEHSPESLRRAQRRILYDLKEIENDNMLFFEVNPSSDSLFKWDVTFAAPNGQAIKAELHFDAQYPFTPPKMFIKQRLFHPNIYENGEVCLQNLKENWNSKMPIWPLILSAQALLSDPNPYDPANAIAANLLLQSPEEYHTIASECFNALDCYEETHLGYGAILQTDVSNSEENQLDEEIFLQIALLKIIENNRIE